MGPGNSRNEQVNSMRPGPGEGTEAAVHLIVLVLGTGTEVVLVSVVFRAGYVDPSLKAGEELA